MTARKRISCSVPRTTRARRRILEGVDGIMVSYDSVVERRKRDPCIVDTEALAELLGSFVLSWNAGHSLRGRGGGNGGGGTASKNLSAVAFLASRSHVSEKTIENIVGRRTITTELRIADPLVAACGYPEMIHNGTIEIRPNPRLSAEARAACCSGSHSA